MPHTPTSRLAKTWTLAAACWCAGLSVSAGAATPAATMNALPSTVQAALTRAKVPADALSVLVMDAQDGHTPRLAYRADAPMNPASVMKLVTTFAALDLLGPAYTWSTPVYLDGPVRDGVLQGSLYIKGQGDPKLVLERLWLLLRRVRGLGITSISGDVVLDRSAFNLPPVDPASFDGEPLRPYNAAPDALLINYKSVVMTFTPERGGNVAHVQFDPPLTGVRVQDTVPLTSAACSDYRGSLQADFSDANRIRFMGAYPASCGEKVWPVAYADPASYSTRAVQGLWTEMGGTVGGKVRYGDVPAAVLVQKPALELGSAPLPEIIRDINKFSNNVMAQQVFLTLGRTSLGASSGTNTSTGNADTAGTADTDVALNGTGGFAAARTNVQRWWKERIAPTDVPVLDNGSGLSRQERITANGLARLLQVAYQSPLMPELMASLPISGVDGTLRRMQTRTLGSAHLKTGSLNNVVAIAGYVHPANGRHQILVAIINHPNANAARPALDAMVEWAAQLP